jgi:hypothetical protein
MNKALFQVYRVLVPKPVRTYLLKKSLRKKIISLYSGLASDKVNPEQKEVISYLEGNGLNIFPYPFHANYSPEAIEVFNDEEKGMKYVVQEGKRLYFKKRWSADRIRRSYCDLMREQDINSPHRYLTPDFAVGNDDVVADIGAAEANFSLSVIDTVKKVYIFEKDREWIEALKVTFAPWPGKVEIVSKYVASVDDETRIKLDTFLKNNSDVTLLKIDVDGAESDVLSGGKEMLSSSDPIRIALCTYHKNDDELEFTALLRDNGFRVSPSKGYMINYYDKKMKSPYLRRGLIRAVRE